MSSSGKIRNIDGRRVFVLDKGVRVVGERDDYAVLGSCGHGGFAYVYKVRAHRSKQIFILKMSSETHQMGDERIRREILVLRQCNESGRGLVPELIDSGELDGRPFYVMENLQMLTWSDDDGGLPNTEVQRKDFIVLLLECVKAIHAAGYLHCDIKPANIMERAGDHRPLLIDFGSAHPISRGGRRREKDRVGDCYATGKYCRDPWICCRSRQLHDPKRYLCHWAGDTRLL